MLHFFHAFIFPNPFRLETGVYLFTCKMSPRRVRKPWPWVVLYYHQQQSITRFLLFSPASSHCFCFHDASAFFILLFLSFKDQLKSCLVWEPSLSSVVHSNLSLLWICTILPVCPKKWHLIIFLLFVFHYWFHVYQSNLINQIVSSIRVRHTFYTCAPQCQADMQIRLEL